MIAFLAARAVFDFDYRAAFFWLALQVFVDATDGALARRAQVSNRLPWFNGAKLDDIVDYLTYVFVPALFVWRAILVPDAWTVLSPSRCCSSSAYGFNRDDAKTEQPLLHRLSLVLEHRRLLSADRWAFAGRERRDPAGVRDAGVRPIRYLYPSRTVEWRPVTMGLGVIWSLLMIVMLWEYPIVSRALFWISLAFPVYYFGLSLLLHARAARQCEKTRQ